MASTARIAACAAILAVAAAACRHASTSDASSICGDLLNLRATVAFLGSPSATATVGQVRGDIEKLDSTIGGVSASGLVPRSLANELSDARDAYRDVFGGIGDDDPFSSVSAEAAAPARRLGAAYDAVVADLACAPSPSPS
jgi:hypothetical protein